MTDKSKFLTTSIILLNEKLHFEGKVNGNAPISIDYTPPLGDNLGYTSLELLLLSLSSCMSSSILVLLRKMGKTISGYEMIANGTRKETHPSGFKNIILEFTLNSENTTIDELSKVIQLSEETYCPVLSMLKGNVEIEIKKSIVV